MTAHADSTLLCETASPHVLLVTLNRPEVRNAFNTRMGEELLDLWTRLTAEPGDVRCVVITGAGEQAFCAGADLKERKGMPDAGLACPARAVRAGLLGAGRSAAAGDRGGQRSSVCRRAGARADVRFRLRGAHRPLRAHRGVAGHHARRGRHAEPAARCRRASRQGDHPHRPPVLRRGSVRMGTGEPAVRARQRAPGGARDGQARSPATRRCRSGRRRSRSATAARWRSAPPTASRSKPTTSWSTPRTGAKAFWPSTRSASRSSREGSA